MAGRLKINKTGYDDLLDGSANIKMLMVGAPGIGKTRSASYWPKPFFLDCENGRGSLADRSVPYVEVKRSKDMLSVLEYLKSLESTPKSQRAYQTIVMDTIDSYARSVKDEWLLDNRKDNFTGYDAWGYLNNRLGALLIRLLNLDYNVIINVHFRDKQFTDEDGKETRELVLQLQGDYKDTIFNDFGLVGFMGSYFEANTDGERVQKRGVTFCASPEKPFLKDRFGVTPAWLPIEFSSTDHTQLVELFAARADLLTEGTEVGEVPTFDPTLTPHVVAPMAGGPVEPRAAKELPLASLTKPELIERAKELGLSVKGNALKGEIIAAIEAALAEQEREKNQPGQQHGHATADRAVEATSNPLPEATSTEEATEGAEPAPAPSPERGTDSNEESPDQAIGDTDGPDDEAVQLVTAELGGAVIEDKPASEPRVESVAPTRKCAECSKDLAAENQDYVALSYIKTRAAGNGRYLCNTDYRMWLAEHKASR